MTTDVYEPLTKYGDKLINNNIKILPNEIENLVENYKSIKEHYNQSPDYQKVSFSQMNGLSSTLPQYIQKVISSQSNFKTMYPSLKL
jgi:hypothetical protein